MLKASGAMAAATLFSRVLGLMREQAYMFFLGTTWVNDAFQYAFTLPNLFRRLLGEGALTAAFIPIFKEKEKTHGEIEMWRAANAVISGLVVAASAIIGLVMLGISLALAVHQFSEKTELMLHLLRVMFPYMLLVCLAAALMGMLYGRTEETDGGENTGAGEMDSGEAASMGGGQPAGDPASDAWPDPA